MGNYFRNFKKFNTYVISKTMVLNSLKFFGNIPLLRAWQLIFVITS